MAMAKAVEHFRNNLDEKMKTLKSKLEHLSCRETDVNAELEAAESRSGKKRKNEVENWLRNVERKKNEFQRLEQEVSQSGIFSHYSLGNQAEKMITEVSELFELGTFPRGLLLDIPETKGAPFLTKTLIGEAFKQNKQKILACLNKDNILGIAIYGMGGAGKTTLATHIYNLLSNDSSNFDYVYWVSVSNDFSIYKLQNDIAKMVKLDLSDEDDVRRRAAKLSKALIQRKKCLLILDDVWKHFPPEEVGIPVCVNGCKLILTTRSLDVCRRMGCQENIKVEPLSEKEAWNLFSENLGHDVALPPDIKEIAMSVAKICAGLPLGIITMAGGMRGVNDICEWRNVLEELEKCMTEQRDMEAEVFPILKFSYHRLQDAKLQLCFLYCALYPEDFIIERDELIGYFIAEGLIDRRKSRQAKFDMGHTLLNRLENACLLEGCQSYQKRCVKIHDLMREMALEITRVSPRFMVKAGLQMRKIPDEQDWMEDLEKVSLVKNMIKVPPGTSPRCPRLSTLLLQRNSFLKRIPNSFFVHMRALRVLDLSHTSIDSLPDSLSDLESLTALLLRECRKLTYVPPLGKLGALQVLDLCHTNIEDVPQGMEMLVDLNCLYMEGTKNLKMLPGGILPTLSHLQLLRLDCSSKHVAVRGEELEQLKQLEEVNGRVYNLYDLNRFVKSHCYGRLRIYQLAVGNFSPHKIDLFMHGTNGKAVSIGNCCLKGGGGGGGDEDRLLLPQDIQNFWIYKCHDVNSLCDVSPSLHNARDLKLCEISWCDGIECILPMDEIEREDSGEDSHWVPFQNLETLYLNHLINLIAVFKWGRRGGTVIASPPPGTLYSLKNLFIGDCHKIKKLFQPGLLQHLQNLECIYVSDCSEMEEITTEDDEGGLGASSSRSNINNSSSSFTLPKLLRLYLSTIPKLKSICKGVMACDSLKEIFLIKCPQLKRLPLSVLLVNGQLYPPPALEKILIEQGCWESLQWDHPNTINVLQPLVQYRT